MDFSDYVSIVRTLTGVSVEQMTDEKVEEFIKLNSFTVRQFPFLSEGMGSTYSLPYKYYDTFYTAYGYGGHDVTSYVTLLDKVNGIIQLQLPKGTQLFFYGIVYNLYPASAMVLESLVYDSSGAIPEAIEVRDQGTTIKYDSNFSVSSRRIKLAERLRGMGFAFNQEATRSDMF